MVEVDLSNVSSESELHELLAREFSFFEEYGANWNALWDCLRDPGLSAVPKQVRFSGWGQFSQRLPTEAKVLGQGLEDLREERPDLTFEWGA